MKGFWVINAAARVPDPRQVVVADAPVIIRAATRKNYLLQVQVDSGRWQDVYSAGAPVIFGPEGDTLRMIATSGVYRLYTSSPGSDDLIWVEQLTKEEARWFMETDLTGAASVLAQYVTASGMITVDWASIQGAPASSPSDIDDAVAKRHQHASALADIDDAVNKRHEHTAGLAAIDQAAAWAHQHASSLTDIDDAVTKRHQHASSLADIDDAVTKRHQHASSLTDIDDAVAKRHDHANKALLDTVSPYDWRGGDVDASVLRSVTLDARPVPQILDGSQSIVIKVAPDAASRQPGDWDKVGWEGVKTAFQAAHGIQQTDGQLVVIRLRPGVYVTDGALSTSSTGGARIRIEAEQAPTLPDPSTWSFYNGGTPDRAADVATLEALYPVRIEFPSWAFLWAYEGATVYFKDILFKATNRGTVFRTRGNTYVYAARCAAIDCGYAANADYGSFVRWDSGVVFPAGTATIANAASCAQVLFNPYGSQPFVGGHCRVGFYGTTGGLTQVWGSTSTHAVLGAISASTGYAYAAGAVQFVRVDLHQCTTNSAYDVFYATEGSRILVHTVRFRGNTGRAIDVVRGSFGYLYRCDLDPSGSSRARTLRAASNGTVWSASLSGGTPVYHPAKGTSTNTGGVNV